MTNDDKHASNDAQNGPAEEVEVEEIVAEPVDEATGPASRGRGAVTGAWLVALLALAAGGGGIGAGWWLWQQQQATNADHDAALAALEERIARIDTTDELANLRRDLTEEVRALRATTAAADREIGNLKDAVGALHDVAMRDQRGWMVAEIEYLVDIANQRLRLVRDLDGAIAALRAADQRVRELGDPKLLPVRESLADEIAMLEDFERPDLVGIALRLDRMATHLKPMPLQLPDQERAERDLSLAVADGEQKTMSGLARHVWNAFSEHITYREYPEPVKALPDTETELHLNQLLRLRLEAARLSVLRQDDAEYHRQLQAARSWVEEKFTGDRAAGLAADLAALDAVNLRPELPELTASLDKLHELERRPTGTAAPAATEPEAAAP